MRHASWRSHCRIGLSMFYGLAGILHLALPGPFLSITPTWVPHAHAVIFVTGICEMAGALAIMTPQLIRFAGYTLALYAICVFPANVRHALDSLGSSHATYAEWIYHILRLPLQPAIVWVTLFATGLVSWPFSSLKTQSGE